MEFTINEPKFWPVSRSSHYSDRRSPATANARSRQSSHWLGLETGHTKGGLNTKLSAIVDLNGSAIALALESGPRADVKAATKELLGVLRVGDCLIGGKGCDSDALRVELLKMGVRDCLANRSNRTEDRRFNKGCYRKRHRVEDFFGRIKKARRIATRYEKLDAHFLGFVQLAAILDWLK